MRGDPDSRTGAQQIYQGKKVLRAKGLGLHPARGAQDKAGTCSWGFKVKVEKQKGKEPLTGSRRPVAGIRSPE